MFSEGLQREVKALDYTTFSIVPKGSIALSLLANISPLASEPMVSSADQTMSGGAFPDPETMHGQSGTPSVAQRAVEAIMSIVAAQKDDVSVSVEAKGENVSVKTGNGNDEINVNAQSVQHIYAGDGDDSLRIMTRGEKVFDIFGYRRASVENVEGGAGNDRISIDSHAGVRNVDGSSGSDEITIVSSSVQSDGPESAAPADLIELVYGGSGDDTISIRSSGSVMSTYGGDGDDLIEIEANGAAFITGGAGNDTIHLQSSGSYIGGGDGNDHIIIESERDRISTIVFSKGSDLLEIDGAVSIVGLARGKDPFDLSDVTIERVAPDTIVLGKKSRAEDRLTIRFSGEMASADALEFELDSARNLVIRAAGTDIQSLIKGQLKIDAETNEWTTLSIERRIIELPPSVARNQPE